jgi:hypothetical protein
MDDRPDPAPAPPGWLEALDRADADLAAGRTVPGDAIMRRLRETLAEMEAKRLNKPARITRDR